MIIPKSNHEPDPRTAIRTTETYSPRPCIIPRHVISDDEERSPDPKSRDSCPYETIQLSQQVIIDSEFYHWQWWEYEDDLDARLVDAMWGFGGKPRLY